MWWAKITDYLNNKSVKLSTADLELLQRVRLGKMADSSIDPFEDWDVDFGDKGFEHPLSAAPEPKSRFVPSKWERLKVSKFI
jgi:ribosome biogenesis protein ERB1